jgi:hypothetical protein
VLIFLAVVNRSKEAFIFSLKNKDGLPPFKSSVLKVEQAAVSNICYGAVFGVFSGPPDLYITGHPPTTKCSTDFGQGYKLPDGYEKGTDKAKSLLAGSYRFTPSEIEVFYQVKK